MDERPDGVLPPHLAQSYGTPSPRHRSIPRRGSGRLGRWTITGVLYAATTLTTALGCGLVAGVFFAFSTLVMPALKRLPSAHGIAAMQSINKLAGTPAFITTPIGTVVACPGMVAWAAIFSSERPSALVLAGSTLYIVGAIEVTIACNVPLNDKLATLHLQSTDAAGHWDEYVTKWTAWNYLRAAASLATATTLTFAL